MTEPCGADGLVRARQCSIPPHQHCCRLVALVGPGGVSEVVVLVPRILLDLAVDALLPVAVAVAVGPVDKQPQGRQRGEAVLGPRLPGPSVSIRIRAGTCDGRQPRVLADPGRT
jgi:hypothetical protein